MDAETSERIKREIREEFAREAPPEGFPKLPDLPGGRYNDPAFFELEQRHLWSTRWLLAGHAQQVPEPGSFARWDDSGVPVLLVRGHDRRIRAFYNTCSHRGAPVVTEASGRAPVLRCGYHGWTYDPEGALIGVPDERDFVDLDRSCRGLTPLRCETWGGLVFVNRDPQAESLSAYLGPIPGEIEDFQLEKLRFVAKRGLLLECNWKVAIDAFLETYHLKHIHAGTVARLIDHRGSTMGLLPRGHSRMPTPVHAERVADRMPGASPLDIASVGEIARVTNLAYNIFPNFVVPLEPVGFPVLLFWPQDIRTTRFDALWFGADWGEGDPPESFMGMIQVFEMVLREDTQFLQGIQRSVESPGFRGIPLSYQERRIYHLHEEIDRVIGRERIPEPLRVEPLLGPHVERARERREDG